MLLELFFPTQLRSKVNLVLAKSDQVKFKSMEALKLFSQLLQALSKVPMLNACKFCDFEVD